MQALISVSDKTGVVEFARALAALGVEAAVDRRHREAAGRRRPRRSPRSPTHTGFPEMLDGRVKTLHPTIHGGLLARRDSAEHMAAIARARHRDDRPARRQPLSVRGDRRQGRLHARRRDREHRHRRPGDGALGGEELEATSPSLTDASQYDGVRRRAEARPARSARRPASRSPSRPSTASRNYDAAISDYLSSLAGPTAGVPSAQRVPGAGQRPLRQAAGPALRREPAPERGVLPRPAPGPRLARDGAGSCRARSSRTTTSPTPTRPGSA